ncbi:MAG: OsmC family peroxiredoxin [Nitrospiraceae bacterium]|nr:MAG: OsmC family peroxiredoxin [Nitrospiraceae bacterium]
MSQATLKEALLKTMDAIKSNPGCANAVFRAQTQLLDDVRCSVKVRDFAPLAVDEPPSLGGTDAGMNPVELVLGALGTCQEIMYAAYASVMGIKLDTVTVDVKGKLNLKGLFGMDDSVPAGYTSISYETTIESPADSESLKKLVQVVESHCPVLDTLTRAIEVKGVVVVNGIKQ